MGPVYEFNPLPPEDPQKPGGRLDSANILLQIDREHNSPGEVSGPEIRTNRHSDGADKQFQHNQKLKFQKFHLLLPAPHHPAEPITPLDVFGQSGSEQPHLSFPQQLDCNQNAANSSVDHVDAILSQC